MRETDILLCCWSVLVISWPTVYCSGWTPIAPPEDYYQTKVKCVSDCKVHLKPHFSDESDGLQRTETQVKSTLLSPPKNFNREKGGLIKSNKKLDIEIYKPTQIPFFLSGAGKPLSSSLMTYHEIVQQSPSSFFGFKIYEGSGKPRKTIYYGDTELTKTKLVGDFKYNKSYKQNLKSDYKIRPDSFLDNDVAFYQAAKGNSYNNHCSLYKVSFRQDLYYQYIQYKVHIPELQEFTLCLWIRFHNHSHDHSLFSYSVKHDRQAIYMWASNLNEPGMFNMKILGQRIFTLNYPIKLYKWYHTCQSWNGNTGEWQVWVNAHRIARGFHNLLVNHPIPGGGIAISGQEHRHFGKGFQEIPHYLKGTGGLEGEITMLQMYKIALTAGKAYNDHSHHHSHYTSTTTEPPEIPTDEPSTTTDHPLLENGQLKKHVNILELAEAIKKGQLDTHHEHNHKPSHYFYESSLGQSYVGHLTPFALHGNVVGLPSHAIFKRNDENNENENQKVAPVDFSEGKSKPERIKVISNVSDQVRVKKIKFFKSNEKTEVDDDSKLTLSHESVAISDNITSSESEDNISQPNSKEDDSEENDQILSRRVGKRLRRHNPPTPILKVSGNRTKKITAGETRPEIFFPSNVKTRPNLSKITPKKISGYDEKESIKRHTLFEEPYLNFGAVGLTSQDVYPAYGSVPSIGYSYNQFSTFGHDFPELTTGEDENADDSLLGSSLGKKLKNEVELAEGEVRRIMELCSGCHVDPFRQVVVISWRSTPKKIYSGTLFLKAKTECENF